MNYYIKTYNKKGSLESISALYKSEEKAVAAAQESILNAVQSQFDKLDKIDDFDKDLIMHNQRIEIKSTDGNENQFNASLFLQKQLEIANWFNGIDSQSVFQKGLRYAGEKHKKQLFPGTEISYLYHISCVASEIYAAEIYKSKEELFNLNYALCLALLHDILEDTDVSEAELKREFGDFVNWGVKALTKNAELEKENRMADSLERILKAPKEVALVKLADRITNLMPPPAHWGKEKIKSYHKQAKLIYEKLGANSAYLGERLKKKITDYEVYL